MPKPMIDTEDRQKRLGIFSVACLIINKMIGTGVFIAPAMVTALTGNKSVALTLWFLGSIYSYCSILIYIEYGLAWPYNGGEFVYISKIFPRPPLFAETSFAWFFVSFSTSTNNALMFAKFCMLLAHKENEWLMKFVACTVTVAICMLHYRLLSIGIRANNILAAYKLGLLLVLVLAGLVTVCIERAHHSLRGSGDFFSTYPEASSPAKSIDCWDGSTSEDLEERKVSGANTAMAALLVLYSYQGWENANYVTSEIEGTPSQQRRVLRRGALLAVTVVSVLYILFNLLLVGFNRYLATLLALLTMQFLLLDFGEIVESSSTVTVPFSMRAFNQHKSFAKNIMYVCIALSSFGNLVGVIFTNARVKRDIALQHIIPFPKTFGQSSAHGSDQGDMLGTPSGGLLLHGLATFITIASVPVYEDGHPEGIMFVINLFTYGHAVLQIFLGIGLIFLQKRMKDNETYGRDPAKLKGPYEDKWPWDYNVLDKTWKRLITGMIFITVNAFVVIMPFVPTTNLLGGCPRRIKMLHLPAIILSTYAAGAIASLVIICFSTELGFEQTKGPMQGDFVSHSARRVWFKKISWKIQGKKEIMTRLLANYEKDTAQKLRTDTAEEKL